MRANLLQALKQVPGRFHARLAATVNISAESLSSAGLYWLFCYSF